MKNITIKTTASFLTTACLFASFSAVSHTTTEEGEQTITMNKQKLLVSQPPVLEKTEKAEKLQQPVKQAKNTTPADVEPSLDSINKTSPAKEHSDTTNNTNETVICIGNCQEEAHESYHCDKDDEECTELYRIIHNRRDGFYGDVSAISSIGDDYRLANQSDSESEFDVSMSFRIQLLGLFIESPGISTRRIHGMYSMPAWGVNFYNSEYYSFDLFYQYSTRGIEGLEGIQTRNKDERAGLRMTGFFENSQLQAIYSPVSRNDMGSDGIEASFSYSHNWQYRNWNYYANVGVQYRSKEVTPFGQDTFIEDDLSTKAGLSYSGEVGIEYPLTTNWVFGGFAAYNALSDRSISQRQDNIEDGYRAGVSLTFIF